jgi:hypothetical protein
MTIRKPDAWRAGATTADGFVERADEYSAVNDRRRAAFPRHVIEDICYADEWIVCTCGDVIKADEDRTIHDRHEPLVTAWATHRRVAGLETRQVA